MIDSSLMIDIDTELEGAFDLLATEVGKKQKISSVLGEVSRDVRVGLTRFAGSWELWADEDKQVSGGLPDRYMPSNTEIERIREKFLKQQFRRLNPNVPNTWLENVPLVGLLAQFYDQGAEGVASEYPKVKKELEEFNKWIESINKARSLTGDLQIQRLNIQELMGR